ncbi:MAG: AIPR family protein, partial [Spirochaetes bacterium]|nr:AIPR family protein [Candidatus Ornithospirochaeta stercoripullorum]
MNGIEYELEASTDNGATKELLFTSKVIETLSDGNNPLLNGIDGDVFRYAPTAFSYHINGYRINDDEKSITVYVTDFVDSQNLVFRNQREVESCMKGVQEFMKLCITDSKNILNQTMDYPIYEFVYQISHNYQDYNEINYVYITNASVREIKLPSFLFNHHKVNIILIDLERYRRFCDGKKILSIDADLNILESPIPFVSFCGINNDYDTYCLLFPGKVLFNFFDAYHYQLLNSNVRTYLQLKGSVNQGIMETIKNEPENFLAYNNGISAVATSVEIDNGCLVKVCDFQIVNGGQTSASIYNAVLKGYSVEKIRVQVKLTVIKNMTKRNEIIKCISRYANTQNAIKFSDFSSNDKYNKTLSDLSRSVCAPQIDSRLPKKWYYENVAGAYNIEKSDAGATFEKEYPKSQMFTKTDMAAYELSYQGFPAEACKGSQDAYKIFVQNLEYLDTPTISDFQHLIAKKILFDSTLKIINELGGQGKKAMACYVVAYMSTVVCDNKLNLDAIWRKQEISEDLESDLRALVYQICPSLRKEAAEIGRNVDMYCRMKLT